MDWLVTTVYYENEIKSIMKQYSIQWEKCRERGQIDSKICGSSGTAVPGAI